ncbi:hypothetical protein PIB30_056350 [Stylosanthes scabra]|uniref:Zinc knuckle CX2CX4HX4C domain-containing protein n=1 Tax=Stylosanthes scabra TaxID=79078 RepID=A0ABU6YIL7_9FABA|nr:hypothetical protein [Stylosanthes scabra]
MKYGFITTLTSIWRQPEGFKVVDRGATSFNSSSVMNVMSSGLRGSSFGEVLEANVFLVRGKENNIVKTRVNLNITKPLHRFSKITGPNQKVMEIALKYERIGSFCHYCGHIGHEIRNCSIQIEDSIKDEVKEEKWGEWLCSEQGSKRENFMKENSNPNLTSSDPSQQPNGRKPIPVNLIKDLASLSDQ